MKKVGSIVVLLIFTLTTVSTVGSAQAGIFCVDKFFNGGGDGVHWSDPANWNGNTLPVPEVDDICIDGVAGNSDVLLDIDYSIGFRSLSITNGDKLTVGVGKTLKTPFDSIIIDPGATLIVRGALEEDGGLVENNGLLQVCIDTGSIADGLEIRGNPPEFIQCEQSVGGELLPLGNTALILAGIQSSAIWMIPTLAGIIISGVYLTKFRNHKN